MKHDFNAALQLIAEERPVDRTEIQPRALRRTVWLLMYSAPGCLPDGRDVCRTKADALDSARMLYADDAPRGFMSELRRNGIAAADSSGYYRVELCKLRLTDLF